MTSGMAWYPLPKSIGGAMSAGDEFFENQSAGWSLWSFSASKDENTPGEKRRSYPSSEEGQSDEQPQYTEDIFLCQFLEEEMKRMDAPFGALDMFPGSMHCLPSYENMLTGVLTGSEEGDDIYTCGFPLFSHDLQNGSPRNAEQSDRPPTSEVKRESTESAPGFEALVLEELEDVVFQLTKRTRICYRDAFYRLAESSKANTGAGGSGTSNRQSFQQPDRNASSRFSTPDCPERETNPIDRTVLVLAMKPPRQIYGNCFPDESAAGAEAQSTTS